jgi:hypothetical protein
VVIFTQGNVKIELRRPRFDAYNVYKKPSKRGSGFYHSWSKLMKKNWMTFRRFAQQSVMPCNMSLDSAGLNFQQGQPLWMYMVEKFVWGLKIIPYLDCHKRVRAGNGSIQRGHGIWIWISIMEKFLLSFEIYTLHGLPQTCVWVWKSVCLLSGVHFACLQTPDPLHPFAKFVTSILPSCQIPHSSSSWLCEVHIPIATLGTRQR